MPLGKKFSYIPFAKLRRQIDLFHASLARLHSLILFWKMMLLWIHRISSPHITANDFYTKESANPAKAKSNFEIFQTWTEWKWGMRESSLSLSLTIFLFLDHNVCRRPLKVLYYCLLLQISYKTFRVKIFDNIFRYIQNRCITYMISIVT